MSAWRDALKLMRAHIVATVWVGALLLSALGVLWLQIPDSHVWQFAFSILMAFVLVAAFLWLCTWIARQLLQSAQRGSLWLAGLLIAAVIVIWWLLQFPIDALAERSPLYSGYWTSKLPHSLRGVHTYEHLLILQEWLCSALRLIAAGLLLPVALLAGGSRLSESVRPLLHLWSRWWYWLTVFVCGWATSTVTAKLVDWTPGKSLSGEIASLILRLGIVFTLDVLLVCFVFAVTAVGLRRKLTA